MDRPASLPGDPVSDVLRLLRPTTVVSAGLDTRGAWGLRFDGGDTLHTSLKFGVVVRGAAVVLPAEQPPLPVVAGDVYLLTSAAAGYGMASAVDVPLEPATPLFSRAGRRDRVRLNVDDSAHDNDDNSTRILGGHFDLDADNAALLLDVLPPVVRVSSTSTTAAALHSLATLLDAELDLPSAAGHAVVLEALARSILVQALRALDDVGSATGTGRRATRGWLRGLGDPQIGAVLRVLHKDVAARPDLHDLAGTAGMSRSAFAARFTQLVGESPLAYAIRWRMTLAKDALRTSSTPIGSIGFALGYESESAFSAAFKREVGVAPRAFRDDVAT